MPWRGKVADVLACMTHEQSTDARVDVQIFLGLSGKGIVGVCRMPFVWIFVERGLMRFDDAHKFDNPLNTCCIVCQGMLAW